jgi:hypothetical protein
MNLQKAEVKLELMRLYVEKLDGMQSGVQIRIGEIMGALEALKAAHKAIDTSHKQYYQAQLDEGKIHVASCKDAMRTLDRVLGSLESLSQKYQAEQLVNQGRIKGIHDSSQLMRTEHDREAKRLQDIIAAIDRGELEVIDGDLRPAFRVVEGQIGGSGASAAADIQRRRAEARAAKAEAATASDVSPTVQTDPPPHVEGATAPVEAATASDVSPTVQTDPPPHVEGATAPVEAATASDVSPTVQTDPPPHVEGATAPVEAATASDVSPTVQTDPPPHVEAATAPVEGDSLPHLGVSSLRDKIAKVRARKKKSTRRRTG